MSERKVVIYEWVKKPGNEFMEKVAIDNGIFHQFGCDYEEFETGAGNYSTAIIEMPDGTIRNVPVELVVFNN